MFNINNFRRATISLTGGKDNDNDELYKHKNLARRASLSNNQYKRAIERANLTRPHNDDNSNRRRGGNKILKNGIVNNMRSSFTSSKSTAQSTQTSTSLYNGYDLPSYDTYTNNQQQEQNNKEECCDPLMYRLQHQQSILKEKHDRRKLRRSISDGEIKERDPFDLWGTSSDEGTTSTSNDNKGSEKDKGQDVADEKGVEDMADLIGDIIHGRNNKRQQEVVDVAGWGGNCSDDDEHEENNNIGTPDCSGWEGSRSTNGGNEVEDEGGIYIDYGSVKTEERKRLPQYLFTPPEMGGGLERIRKRQSSQKHDVEEEQYDDDENDDDDNSTYTHTGLFVDFGGIVPQDDIPTGQHKSNRRRSQCTSDAQIHNKSHRRRKRSNSITSRGSYKSHHSDLSSVTNFTNWPNDDDDDENENDYFDNYEESRGYETSEGTSKNRRASLAELEDILSSLEKEALTPTSSLFDNNDNTTRQQKQTKAAVVDKSLQIPSMLSPGCGQESQQQSDESQQKKVSPSPSIKSQATTTTQRRLTLSKEEENDPRLFQLNQSSIEELQIELSNMQSQSKSNLELSWGDTERMRCEVTELDDKITEIKKKLDDANNKLVASSRSSSFYPPKHTTRHFVETNFGTTSKSVCPPRVKLRRRRRRTIEGGSMRFSQTVAGSFVANADSLLGLVEGGEPYDNTINLLPNSIIDLANIRPQLNRRSISSRSCGDKSQEEEELLGDSLDDSNEVKSFCTAPAKSSFKADKYSAEALRALLEAGDNNDDGMLVGDVNQSNSSIISSDLGIDLDIHSRDALLSTDGLLALTTTSSSTNSKPEIDDKIFKSLLSFPTPDATDDEGQSGVFYPAPNDEDEEEDSSSDSSVQSGVIFSTLDGNDNDSGHYPSSRHESVAMASLAMDAMEDFDFDPLKSLATDVDNDCKSVKSIKSTKSTKSGKFLRRPSMNRRPSIMGFFDSNDDLMTDVEPPPASAQPDGNLLAKQVGKNRSIKRIKSRIEEKEEELDRMTKSVQEQEDKIQTCELNIDEANINCSQKEGQLKDEESTAQQEVKALMQKDGDSETKLEDLEDAEKDVLLRERELIKQLANMPEVCIGSRDDEIELEKQLSLWQQKYDNIQEKAIGSLSSLLNEFDTLGIPNLQEDIESSKRGEDTVSADIIARYDIFLDKESELVRVLSEQERLSTFETIKSQCERSIYVGKQLSKLQADLAIHSLNLTSMIDGDDQGTDVTSSSTASERLSMEKEFVDAVISNLNSANRSQEELILETLPKIVQHLKYWEKIILPCSSSSSSDTDHTDVNDRLPMLDGLVKSVEETLAQSKSNILDEHSKYLTAMERADLSPSSHHSTLEAKSKVLS